MSSPALALYRSDSRPIGTAALTLNPRVNALGPTFARLGCRNGAATQMALCSASVRVTLCVVLVQAKAKCLEGHRVSAAKAALAYRPVSELKPYPRNARTHSKKQVQQIARSIERFGFTNPVLVSDDGEIIAGHGRVRAAALLGLAEVPTLALSHLSPSERRAYVLADNKLALNAG